MKTNKIYLCALGLMLGVAVHWGCQKESINDEVGPVIKIPCRTNIDIDGCQNKIEFSGERVSAVYLNANLFACNSLSNSGTQPAIGEFLLCNPDKIKGLNLKTAKTYADGEKYIFKVNLREPCYADNGFIPAAYFAEIISIETVPSSK